MQVAWEQVQSGSQLDSFGWLLQYDIETVGTLIYRRGSSEGDDDDMSRSIHIDCGGNV
jgi:hypothetical protein